MNFRRFQGKFFFCIFEKLILSIRTHIYFEPLSIEILLMIGRRESRER